jgi:hypothetical protein
VDELIAVTRHRNATTARRFYDGAKVPRMLVLPVNLQHPDDTEPRAA